MERHTPGPWTAHINLRKLRYDIHAESWRTLARVYLNDEPELLRQGHANARLIAAAPDLLQACEALVAAFPRSALDDDVAYSAWRAGRRAIAKARGEVQ